MMHTQITKLKKAGMGPAPGMTGMELPFPSSYTPCFLLPKLKSKQSTWAMIKPDHHATLEGATAEPGGIIYCWYLLISPQRLWFIHNIWASSLTGKLMRALVPSEAMETENDVGGLSTGIWTLPNVMFFSKEHSGCK